MSIPWWSGVRGCVVVLAIGCDAGEAGGGGEQGEGVPVPTLKLRDRGAKVIGFEIVDVTIPASLHAQGLAIPAKLARPKWSKEVGPRPGVLVLHGSGGLLKMPKSGADDPCSPDMEAQFAGWAETLAKRGYTALLPSSYSARGFCDEHKDTARIPETFDEKPEVVLGRIYDADAAARFLCERPEVDCERMALLGFSQGATAVMTTLHWQIEPAIAAYRAAHPGEFDIEIPDLAPGRPSFRVGIAYYPGCGFDGFLTLSTGAKTKPTDKFTAGAPLFVLHGSEDPLIEHCSVEYGAGTREIQSAQVAAAQAIGDTYSVTVYPDAGHSFDSPGGSGSGGGHPGDAAARDAALLVTTTELAKHLE